VADVLTTAAEQRDFRSGVRRFLAERSTEQDVRRLADDPSGYDPDVWKQLAAELGLPGLLVPERQGGQGLTMVETVIALEEAGRALLCAPLLSTAVLAPLALADATEADELLRGSAGGSMLLALALDDDPQHAVVAADGALTGRKVAVLDAHIADRLLVVVGDRVYDVSSAAARLTTTRTIDLAISLSTVELTSAPAVLVGRVDVQRLRALAAIATAAHLVGVGAAALDLAVDYAKAREQFGKPIGSYQGVKHLVADMHARLESGRAAVAAAAVVAVTRPDELPEHAAVAKAWCANAMVRNAEDCIQVMGGIGFTWEHPAHLFLRRAKVYELLFGDARAHRRQLAEQLGLV
jgi:alkylation response protein AidB-like acyl-CoA dehydrogenase